MSAPGKVLITGGYLVLEVRAGVGCPRAGHLPGERCVIPRPSLRVVQRPLHGLVVSTTARFHSSFQWEPAAACDPAGHTLARLDYATLPPSAAVAVAPAVGDPSTVAVVVRSPQFSVTGTYTLGVQPPFTLTRCVAWRGVPPGPPTRLTHVHRPLQHGNHTRQSVL